jgi:hypothetical protein
MTQQFLLNTALIVAVAVGSASAQTSSSSGGSDATVQISHPVSVNGTSLAPGTYQLRFTNEFLAPNLGQSAQAERWVEFVKDGAVVAKASATAWTGGPGTVGTSSRGGARTQMLRGGEAMRITAVHDGTRYLIHLPIGK